MKNLLSSSITCVLLAGPLVALAQNPSSSLRPGLWEHGFTMKTQSGQMEAAMKKMQQTMANLPAAQRKMMEDMLGKQGIGLGAGGTSVKVCMSREQAERGAPPPQEGCTQDLKRNGNIWQVAFQCKGPPPSSGEGQVTLLSPTAYSGNFNVLTEVNNKPERVQMTQNGKWLGADCGNIKPAPSSR